MIAMKSYISSRVNFQLFGCILNVFLFTITWLPACNSASNLYSEYENQLQESGINFANLVAISHDSVRSLKKAKVTKDILDQLVQVDPQISQNVTAKLSKSSKKWCDWALSEKGGKVKLGETFGILSTDEVKTFEGNQCGLVAKGLNPSCDDIYGDGFMSAWRRNQIRGLCEDSASSKLNCVDSPVSGSRMCTFENAMMSFRKMMKVTNADGSAIRRWEKGFLSADCGYMGKDDIGE